MDKWRGGGGQSTYIRQAKTNTEDIVYTVNSKGSGPKISSDNRLSENLLELRACGFAIRGANLLVIGGLKTSASPQIHTYFLTNIAYTVMLYSNSNFYI
jgi:hypothetical protein